MTTTKARTRRKSRELRCRCCSSSTWASRSWSRCAPPSGASAKTSTKSPGLFRRFIPRSLRAARRDRSTHRAQRRALAHGAHGRRRSQPAALRRGGVPRLPLNPAPGDHQRVTGNRAPLLYAGVSAVHQRRAGQRRPRARRRQGEVTFHVCHPERSAHPS